MIFMGIKGWAEAQNYKGGIIKYLYDKVKALDSASGDSSELTAKIEELESRIEALENAP